MCNSAWFLLGLRVGVQAVMIKRSYHEVADGSLLADKEELLRALKLLKSIKDDIHVLHLQEGEKTFALASKIYSDPILEANACLSVAQHADCEMSEGE